MTEKQIFFPKRNDATNTRFTCTDITPQNAVKHHATVKWQNESLANGYVDMIQYVQSNNITTPTLIALNVYHTNINATKTLNHKWHIHRDAINSTHDKINGVCSSAGPHYNPLGVSTAKPAYSAQCNPKNPWRCDQVILYMRGLNICSVAIYFFKNPNIKSMVKIKINVKCKLILI